MHLEFKIQEIFPWRLANLINKLMLCTFLFIRFVDLSGQISYILLLCKLSQETLIFFLFYISLQLQVHRPVLKMQTVQDTHFIAV